MREVGGGLHLVEPIVFKIGADCSALNIYTLLVEHGNPFWWNIYSTND